MQRLRTGEALMPPLELSSVTSEF